MSLYCMDSIDAWWWVVLIVTMSSGALGGYCRYLWEEIDRDGHGKGRRFNYVLLGVAAALMVPLFLNTISSSLIRDSQEDNTKLFVLIGFCIAAGAFSKQFMGSVAKRALELSREAKTIATKAEKKAHEAGVEARAADNRAISVYDIMRKTDQNEFTEALRLCDSAIDRDPKNSEAHAWRAFCLKRLGRVQEALLAINTALREEGRAVAPWLYNKACYEALLGAPAATVVEELRKSIEASTATERTELKGDLLTDDDFASVRNDASFQALLNSLPASAEG